MSKKFPFDLNKKILPHFNSYSTYDGVITSEQMSQFSGKDYNSLIRLNANENPFGTHESIIKSLENQMCNDSVLIMQGAGNISEVSTEIKKN